VISDVRNLALRIDPASNRVTGRPVRVGDQPTGAVVAFGALWVASHDQGLVSRVDLRSGRVINVADPWSIHFLAAGAGRVWASHYHDGTLTCIDPVGDRVVGRPIVLPFAPGALAAGPDAVWVMRASPDTPGGSAQLARLDPRAAPWCRSGSSPGSPRSAMGVGRSGSAAPQAS
jgi:DNA-binding beta-propeller fold protein YncE